jgi:microcystin-dependent protein
MKAIFFLIITNGIIISCLGQQSVSINNTGTAANASAILDVSSTTKGMLIPRMDSIQRKAILNTAVGLMVFDNSTNSFWFYQASGWTELQSVSTNPWQKSGNNIYNSNSGDVGINNPNPKRRLEVYGDVKADSAFITNTATATDFLVVQDANGQVGHRKTFYGLGFNYCISLQGVYPSQGRPADSLSASSTLSADPFIGEIMLFAGNFPPNGWAYCNGQLLPISQYVALFSILGTTYGGDGVSTFALPDFRNAVPVGFGNNWLLGQSNK